MLLMMCLLKILLSVLVLLSSELILCLKIMMLKMVTTAVEVTTACTNYYWLTRLMLHVSITVGVKSQCYNEEINAA